MGRVHVVTDSAATLDSALVERLGVRVLPLTVRVDGQVLRDDGELNPEELLMWMNRRRVQPTIVGPTATEFRAVYADLLKGTDQIISLHSSDKLSAICREARIASRDFLGRCDIMVLDSQTLSVGQAILVENAARLAQEDQPLGEIVRQIRGMIRRIYVVLLTDSLDYLERNQLISPAQAILGTMLGIKPFLAIEEGAIIPMEKVRSRERAIDKLAEFAAEFSSIQRMVILQSTSYPTDSTRLLQERLALAFPGQEFSTLVYGPLLASHVGPDAIGLIVYEGSERAPLPY